MATPAELDLIKAGIDKVIKVQTKNGRLMAHDIAPVINHREGYYRVKVITGFGDAGVYGRGAPVASDRKQALYDTEMYPLRFAKAWEHDTYDEDEDVYNEMADNAADIAKAMRRRKNKEASNLFGNGFDSAYPIYDGQVLFSTAHPGITGVTGSNRPAAGNAMGVLAMENVIGNYFGQNDPRGESMEFEGNLECWVGNTLFPLTTRIVDSLGVAQSADNDPNFVGRYITVKRGDKLTSSTAHYYKAKDQDEHGLRCIVFSPYRIDSQEEARTGVTVHVVSERYRMVVMQWQGTYGDPGA